MCYNFLIIINCRSFSEAVTLNDKIYIYIYIHHFEFII